MSEILINLPSPTLHSPISSISKNDEYLYNYDDFLEKKLNEQKENFSRIVRIVQKTIKYFWYLKNQFCFVWQTKSISAIFI